MAQPTPFENSAFKKKSFWQRPEGVTGALFMAAIVGAIIYGASLLNWPAIFASTFYLIVTVAVLAAVLYMVFDPKMRNLVWYMYKSMMRSITGVFVNIDPIGILKSYVEDLQDNLGKMSKQIGELKGQIRKISTLMSDNNKEMENQMRLASRAKQEGKNNQVVLASRKAARLQETNAKYNALHKKMEVMYRILDKMYKNSEILLEDTKDQVKLKEQERKAIRASHGAMKSAMNVMSGDPDKRAMFDAAIENIADDVANKVGEMERFMELSANFMDKVDLQNGVFEDQGLAMLEEWEKKSDLMMLDSGLQANEFDLDGPVSRPEAQPRSNSKGNSYDNLFD